MAGENLLKLVIMPMFTQFHVIFVCCLDELCNRLIEETFRLFFCGIKISS